MLPFCSFVFFFFLNLFFPLVYSQQRATFSVLLPRFPPRHFLQATHPPAQRWISGYFIFRYFFGFLFWDMRDAWPDESTHDQVLPSPFAPGFLHKDTTVIPNSIKPPYGIYTRTHPYVHIIFFLSTFSFSLISQFFIFCFFISHSKLLCLISTQQRIIIIRTIMQRVVIVQTQLFTIKVLYLCIDTK